MGERESIKTTVKEAVEYWSGKVDECGLSVDWSEADTHCWRCGCQKNLQRCHIVPYSRGGKDEPCNIVLLCNRCHIDGPNVDDPDIMWDWIKAYGVALYETFWNIVGMKEYEFIYKKPFFQEVKDVFATAGITPGETEFSNLKEIIQESLNKTSYHFGHPYLNTATLAGVYRMSVKSLAHQYGVEFPIADKNEIYQKSWWVKYIFNTECDA